MHKVDFKNGHLFCEASQEGDENGLFETLEVYQKMKEYYNSMCTVRHIVRGKQVESRMTVYAAIWQMKEGWLVGASFVPDEK